MEKFKCITFDKEAQNDLPQHIKEKMKKDREKAEKMRDTTKKEYHCPVYSSRALCSWYRKDKSACGSCSCKVDA